MVEVLSSSETSGLTRAARLNVPEDGFLYAIFPLEISWVPVQYCRNIFHQTSSPGLMTQVTGAGGEYGEQKYGICATC
jgi:hypothetical protein